MGGWRRDGWLALDFRFWSSLFLFIHLMEKNAVISYLDSLGFFFLSLCLIRAGDLCLYIQSRSWIYSAYLPLSDVGGSRDSQSDFFCVFWISRHPRTSYRIKSVYSLMPQTIVERSSFFSFLFFGCVFAEDALVAVMIGRTRAYILRPIVGYSIYACLYLPWAPSWGNCTIRISPR